MNQRATAIGILVLVAVTPAIWLVQHPARNDAATPTPRVQGAHRITQPAVTTRSTASPPVVAAGVSPVPKPRPPGSDLDYSEFVLAVSSWVSRHDLGLTAGQQKAVNDVLCAISDERRRYEAEQAVASPVAANEVLIEIPAYPEFGQRLRAEFERLVTESLGGPLGARFLAATHTEVSDLNAAWGALPQEILVRYDAAAGDYKVTHRMRLEKTAPFATPPVRVSNSALLPNRLGIYAPLQRFFPPAGASRP